MTDIAHTTEFDQPVDTKILRPLDWLAVNRNLMHYPIARDNRVRLKWTRNSKRGYRRCMLNSRAMLELPLDCGFKRHPTGFDVKLLLTLATLANVRNNGRLELANTDILRHMGEPINSRSRAKVTEALKLWRHATLQWTRWYVGDGKYERRTASNLIRRKGIYIIVSDECRVWFDPGFGFYESVPLTLPSDTATQNLILLVLAKRRNPDDDWTKRKFRSRREITRKLGINHSGSRNATLYKAMNHARQWFEKHDGELKWKYLRNGKVLFKFQRPFAEPQPVQVVGRCHA